MELSVCLNALPPYVDYMDVLRFRYQCVANNFQNEIQLTQTLFAIFFGAGGFAFGIWRTWRYRERYLFSRLQEFLGHEAAGIEDATQHIVSRTVRPSIHEPGLTSFDTLWPLAQLRRSFVPVFAFVTTRTAAHQHLEDSADSLVRVQENFAKYHAQALKKALTARLLCSAVDASTAAGAGDAMTKQVHTELAHEHVRAARKLPDCLYDPDALEIEINLLLAEKEFQAASTLAQKILAPEARTFITDERSEVDRDLSIGRAHKYQALARIANGKPKLAANCLDAALSKFRKHPHVREIDLLDFAQIAELRAATAKRVGAGRQKDRNGRIAEICYTKLENTSNPWKRSIWAWAWSKLGGDRYQGYLHKAATAGLARIKRLRAEEGYYPPPFPPAQPPNSSLAPMPPA